MSKIQGVVCVYVVDNRVVAHVADFSEAPFSHFDQQESQRIRAGDKLAKAVLKAYCAHVVPDSLSDYDCKRVVEKMPGDVHSLSIGYENE